MGVAASGRLLDRAVVGVFGNKQHGKDSFGQALQLALAASHGVKTKCMALADPVKIVTMHLVGMPSEVAFGGYGVDRERLRREWKRYGKNGREWLQWVGTEMGRDQIDPDLWVDRLVDRVTNDSEGTQVFIITDCRFHSEMQGFKDRLSSIMIDFVPVRVVRPDMEVDLGHRSESEVAEMGLALFDAWIENNRTLEDLQEKAREFADRIAALVKA